NHQASADTSATRSPAARERTDKHAPSASSQADNTLAAAPAFSDVEENAALQPRTNLCPAPALASRSPRVFANYVPTVGTPRDSHTAHKERVFGQDAWLGPFRPLIH